MDNEMNEKVLRELRGQVNTLSSIHQLLTARARERGEPRELGYLATMNQSLYRLIRTLSHLELCRECTPVLKPVDLSAMCQELCLQVSDLAKELDVRFSWTAAPETVVSLADKGLLQQALLNLLTNAFEAAGTGGRVQARCALEGGEWVMAVSDDGPGLWQQTASEDVFLKQPGGVGLGLETVSRIIEAHNGRFIRESGKAGGSQMLLRLPLQDTQGQTLRTPEGGFEPGGYDRLGGFEPLLTEFSPLLGKEYFQPPYTE